MELVNGGTPAGAAAWAARFAARILHQAIEARGTATLALSGGGTGIPFLEALAVQPLDWSAVTLFQVDERVVPRGSPDRNLTALEDALVIRGPVHFRQLRPLWVDRADLDQAAADYSEELAAVAGHPPVLDLVHLGLGADGHTASLFPGDPALSVTDRWVAVTGEQAGFRRLTLTLPVLNGARQILWLVTGAAKAGRVGELLAGGGDFPAAAVNRSHATLVVDSAAAPRL
jgi:6-phosphogluconolactonase